MKKHLYLRLLVVGVMLLSSVTGIMLSRSAANLDSLSDDQCHPIMCGDVEYPTCDSDGNPINYSLVCDEHIQSVCGDGVCDEDEIGLCEKDHCSLKSCDDSHAANDLFVKGYIKADGKQLVDFCFAGGLVQYDNCFKGEDGGYYYRFSFTRCLASGLCEDGTCSMALDPYYDIPCRDYDDGKKYFVPGLISEGIFNDICYDTKWRISDWGDVSKGFDIRAWECEGSTCQLWEFYCDPDVKREVVPCPGGCSYGACMQYEVSSPFCWAVGESHEGWYHRGSIKAPFLREPELIKRDQCEGCEAVCGAIGSRSEGWYSSCTNELIKYEQCGSEEPPPSPICGNRILEKGEECDDGNNVSGDGCSPLCTIEIYVPQPPSTCTDSDGGIDLFKKGKAGVGDKVEIDYCQDDKHVLEFDCGWENGIADSKHSGFGGARYDCTYGCKDGACLTPARVPLLPSPSLPHPPICGNGIIEPPEECDDHNLVSGDGCSSVCQREVTPIPSPLPTSLPVEYEEEVQVAPSPQEVPQFSDVHPLTLEGQAANYLAGKGVIGGFPDGEFKGYRPVNRAEAAKFLLLARFDEVPDRTNDGRFWDVLEGEWYVKYVIYAAEQDIISGHPDGSFRPADAVNTAEFLKMLSLAFDLPLNLPHSYQDVSDDAWYAKYVGVAEQYHLMPGRRDYFQPQQELTRGEVAIAIYQLLVSY